MTPTENFISHLIELRNRLLRIVAGLIVVFIAFFPFANQIYAQLAAPLLNSLPAGGQMIATDVTSAFFVPTKVAMIAAFVVSLPHTMYQVWAFVAPGLYAHEKKMDDSDDSDQLLIIFSGDGICLLLCIWRGICLYCQNCACWRGGDDRYWQLFRLCTYAIFCFWAGFSSAHCGGNGSAFWLAKCHTIKRGAWLCDCWSVYHWGYFYSTRHTFAIYAGCPDVATYELGIFVAGFMRKSEENTLLPPV